MYSYKNTIYMYNTYEDKDLFLCDISDSVIWRHCKTCQCRSFLYLIRDEPGQNLARNLALTQEIIRRIWVNLSIFLNDPNQNEGIHIDLIHSYYLSDIWEKYPSNKKKSLLQHLYIMACTKKWNIYQLPCWYFFVLCSQTKDIPKYY